MRVAALYDVHGNLPALEAVLAEVPDDAAIVSGGDVFSGPMPAETSARAFISSEGTPTATLAPTRSAGEPDTSG